VLILSNIWQFFFRRQTPLVFCLGWCSLHCFAFIHPCDTNRGLSTLCCCRKYDYDIIDSVIMWFWSLFLIGASDCTWEISYLCDACVLMINVWSLLSKKIMNLIDFVVNVALYCPNCLLCCPACQNRKVHYPITMLSSIILQTSNHVHILGAVYTVMETHLTCCRHVNCFGVM
jgi:hypothetical protein